MRKFLLWSAALSLPAALCFIAPAAQTQTPASAGRKVGTVKAVTGNGFSLATDDGQQLVVTIQDGARVLQLPAGSKDIKSAQPIALTDISVGDRVLVTGRSGDDTRTFGATLVLLMKAGDIAQQHATEQAAWQKNGLGGIVSATDPASGSLTLTAGKRQIVVKISSTTKFRRYAGDSVKFEDAQPGTLTQIAVGDQLRARGVKSEDGASIQADEVVSGSFKNVAGLIASVDTAAGKLTLKDLATKKTVTVAVTANTSIRTLPPDAAARFAARAKSSGSAPPAHNAQGEAEGDAARHSAGADLSDLVSRLPNQSVGDLKSGEAAMIVASQPDPADNKLTAITVLLGVEPVLAATPGGTPSMTLSPWSVGASDAGAQ